MLKLNSHGGDLFVFRGRRGHLLKVLWADGLGLSLYIKRLERGHFVWPAPVGGVVPIGGAQLAYLLDGIDWRRGDCGRLNRRSLRWITSDRDCGLLLVMTPVDALPDDTESPKRLLLAREVELAAVREQAASG